LSSVSVNRKFMINHPFALLTQFQLCWFYNIVSCLNVCWMSYLDACGCLQLVCLRIRLSCNRNWFATLWIMFSWREYCWFGYLNLFFFWYSKLSSVLHDWVWTLYACVLIGVVVIFPAIDSNDECAEEGEVFEFQEEGDQGQANQGKPSTWCISESYYYTMHCLLLLSYLSIVFYIAINP
jgi:hypothetical protein